MKKYLAGKPTSRTQLSNSSQNRSLLCLFSLPHREMALSNSLGNPLSFQARGLLITMGLCQK